KVAYQLLDEPLQEASIRAAFVSPMMPPGPNSYVMTMESGARAPAPGLPEPVAKAPSFTVVAGDFERVLDRSHGAGVSPAGRRHGAAEGPFHSRRVQL